MCARWFNIDSITPPPEDYTIALKHIPWVIKYYEDDLDAQAQIQREWALYRADLEIIDKKEIDSDRICIYGNNGEPCLS